MKKKAKKKASKAKKIECDQVITRRLAIVDKSGRDRCTVQCWGDDENVQIDLSDREGLPRVTIVVSDSGASISVDAKGAASSVRAISNELGNGLAITSADQHLCVSLGLRAGSEHPFMEFRDRKGNLIKEF